jgi:sigma-B regulation protein RsbU (phosphoserine phosphatase)
LPRTPLQLDGCVIAGYCAPATDVGGDYFDYFTAHGSVDIVIADVSGHSVGAALVMAEARSTLKAEAYRKFGADRQPLRGTGDILGSLNGLLHEDLDRAGLFITMFYMRYHAATRELLYSNAGHNRPLLLRRGSDHCIELDAEGLVLGVRRNVRFDEESVTLEPGDVLMLYTDGISEAQNTRGDFFGVERLCDTLVLHRLHTPQEIIEIVRHELEGFCQSTSFVDDLSMVVLTIHAGGRG